MKWAIRPGIEGRTNSKYVSKEGLSQTLETLKVSKTFRVCLPKIWDAPAKGLNLKGFAQIA